MSLGDQRICSSGWHDEAHSSHSSCGQCGGKGMRKEVERREREAEERFIRQAENWARENGWTPPKRRAVA